jgi:hypothetical protein
VSYCMDVPVGLNVSGSSLAGTGTGGSRMSGGHGAAGNAVSCSRFKVLGYMSLYAD